MCVLSYLGICVLPFLGMCILSYLDISVLSNLGHDELLYQRPKAAQPEVLQQNFIVVSEPQKPFLFIGDCLRYLLQSKNSNYHKGCLRHVLEMS